MKKYFFGFLIIVNFFIFVLPAYANDFYYAGNNPVGKLWALLIWEANGDIWSLLVSLFILFFLAALVPMIILLVREQRSKKSSKKS